jgi:tetratricopeptide (TPR) repeat protein
MLLASSPARAHSDDPRPEPPPASEPQQRARALFLEGSALYDRGDYQEAIVRFAAAYELFPRPELLFNIAQAYRLQGPSFCGAALRYYEWHLHDQPEASNRAELEELIAQMRACAQAQVDVALPSVPVVVAPPPIVAVAAPPRVDRPPPVHRRWAGWGAIAGGATALAGVGTYAVAHAKYETVKAGAPYPRGTFRRWELITDASYGAMAAGAVAGGVGLVLWWPSETPGPRSSRAGGLALAASF